MQKAISAIQQLLKSSSQDTNSPLYGVKKVYFGDPIKIAESDFPAIAIQPAGTQYQMRGSRYDQKTHSIEIRLIVNTKDYFDTKLGPQKTIASASWATAQITFGCVGHGLSVGDAIQVSGTNFKFNGAYYVSTIVNADSFKVSAASEPGVYSGGCYFQTSDNEKVFIVEDLINKVEQVGLNHETAGLSVCGTIQQNPNLPLTDANGTNNTATNSHVDSVNYSFSDARGFPTFEVVTTVSVVLIGDR